jgi:MOSC domain-containing protein YiiM
MLGLDDVDASVLRRNIVVAGINLLALKDCIFSIGNAHLKMTGLCHPCSRMEQALGPGGYNAMRGHGGINATVVRDGQINIGDDVSVVQFV